jgi:hypothetical protein
VPGQLQPEQLEALVSPVALFPDPLLGQVFEAATRPDQVAEAAKWAKDHPGVSGKDLESALQGMPWAPSVKALVSFPDVMKMMSEHPDWARDLGLAYQKQKDAVLFAVQQLRARALAAGNLQSNSHQTIQVEPVPESQGDGGGSAPTTIIRIEPADPQVIYVPAYNPTVVYGTWVYPAYPPPPVYPPGYVAGAAMVSFSIGFAIGSSYWRYPPYPPYPRYPPYRPPPPGARPPAGGYPPAGGRPPGQGAPTPTPRPSTPSQLPAGGDRGPGQGVGGPSAGQLPSGGGGRPGQGGVGAPSAGQLPGGGGGPGQGVGGPSAGQLPAGGGTRGPSQMPSGGDRGWGAAAPASRGGGSGGSAFGGMNSGTQTRAASTRGNASFGASRGGGARGGGGRR